VLAVMVASARIGCGWCLDFGHWIGVGEGVQAQVLRQVPHWRESDAFTPVGRRVLEYAEAMTASPPEVTDELVARLATISASRALVELAMMVAAENQRSRFNAALGSSSQAFSDRCELPAPARDRRPAARGVNQVLAVTNRQKLAALDRVRPLGC
jgi:alkylhydroperoxidase family enzyme